MCRCRSPATECTTRMRECKRIEWNVSRATRAFHIVLVRFVYVLCVFFFFFYSVHSLFSFRLPFCYAVRRRFMCMLCGYVLLLCIISYIHTSAKTTNDARFFFLLACYMHMSCFFFRSHIFKSNATRRCFAAVAVVCCSNRHYRRRRHQCRRSLSFVYDARAHTIYFSLIQCKTFGHENTRWDEIFRRT